MEEITPLDAAFSYDGRVLALSGTENNIRLYGTGTGVYLGACTGHKQIVLALAFVPNQATLASVSEDGTLRLWNVPTQQELINVRPRGGSLARVIFSPDGSLAVVGRTTGGALLLRAPEPE